MAIQSFKRSTLTNNQKYRGFLAGNPPVNIPLSYVVVAGGGESGRGNPTPGSGGAGGYRSSWNNELSGGNGTAEPQYVIPISTSITVTVGAGGPKVVNPNESGTGSNGSASALGVITTVGGGGGGGPYQNGQNGGSGGGGGYGMGTDDSGAGTANQGFPGGDGGNNGGGDGGGAGAPGRISNNPEPAGNGSRTGVGRASTITGTSVVRAAGNGGATPNTGNGGVRSYDNTQGASGVVIIRYPAVFNVIVGAGLTANTSFPTLDEKVTIFTAGTGTVSFA
jgi:hypothetical protein